MSLKKIRVLSGLKWTELAPVDTVMKHRVSTKRTDILDRCATVRFRCGNLTDDSIKGKVHPRTGHGGPEGE